MAKNIFDTYSFDANDVIFKLETQQSITTAYCKHNMQPITIVVGIKEYFETNRIDENEIIYFQNSILHECEHANTQVHLPNALKQTFVKNKLSYAYWAFKLLDEYTAYTKANEKYKQDKKFLQKPEDEILKAITHYGQRLKIANESDYFIYADSYYDLGSAFIAHKCVNPEFPSIDEENYLTFVNSYFYHLKVASERSLNTYDDYATLSQTLLEDFKLLIKCAKKQNPSMDISYDNFLINSHMN